MSGFLAERELAPADGEPQDSFTATRPAVVMWEVARDFCQSHADYKEEDAALMAYYLIKQVPVDERENETRQTKPAGCKITIEEEQGVNWEIWLEKLRALPAEAPEWGKLMHLSMCFAR